MSSSFWNDRYGALSPNEYAFGTEPNVFLTSCVASECIPSGGHVLCIGEGEGRNAVYLASSSFLGCHVTAVDSSSEGLAKVRKLASSRGVEDGRIRTVCADLGTFEPMEEDGHADNDDVLPGYDAVVSVFCHLPPPVRERAHRKCAEALRPGGTFILEAYTPRQLGRGTGGPPSADMMMSEEILRSDLEVCGLEFEVLRECDRNVAEGLYHTGMASVVQMVARKPWSAENDCPVGPTKAMPLLPITSPETVRMCKSLPLRPDDVFICSYPKSGTTWTQHIVLSLLLRHRANVGTDAEEPPLEYNHISDYAPFYDVDQHWDKESGDLVEWVRTNHARLGRRVFNTHLWWDMLPDKMVGLSKSGEPSPSAPGGGGGTAKFIYVVRSPLDACVSFYHHLSHQQEGGYDGSFDDFFREWKDGEIAFGSWTDHILSFAPALADPGPGRDVLLLSYEDMMTDLRSAVERVASFLSVSVTPDEVEEMLPSFEFSSMKSDIDKFQPRTVTWKGDFQFLRRGMSGDSLSEATGEQREEWREQIAIEGLMPKLRRVLRCKPEVLEKLLALCS